MNNLFVTTPEPEERGATQGPTVLSYPHPSTARSFPVFQPRYHKLSFPTYDGKEEPLPWLNRCEQFFRGQKTPNNEKV
jgi:hypothetical protein